MKSMDELELLSGPRDVKKLEGEKTDITNLDSIEAQDRLFQSLAILWRTMRQGESFSSSKTVLTSNDIPALVEKLNLIETMFSV